MRRTRVVLLSALLALVVVAGVGMLLARNGLSARTGLSPFEDGVLYELRKRVIALDTTDLANPQRGRWREAVHHFEEECAVCHGRAGRGDGPLGTAVFPPAPNLTRARTQSLSDAELHHIIAEGIRFTAMPAMGGRDSEDEIWQLVALVRELPKLSEEQMKRATEAEPHGQDHAHPVHP